MPLLILLVSSNSKQTSCLSENDKRRRKIHTIEIKIDFTHCNAGILFIKTSYTLVQWWRHFIMLPYQHMVIGSKWTNQTMNRMIAHYQWERYMAFQEQNLINICYCIVVQLNRNFGWDQDIGSCESLVRCDFQNLLTILGIKDETIIVWWLNINSNTSIFQCYKNYSYPTHVTKLKVAV